MDWTEKQEKEVVKHNINQAKMIINEAERVNKGRYVHNINSNLSQIKSLLKKKKQIKVLGSEEFLEMCRIKNLLAADLYMNEKGI